MSEPSAAEVRAVLREHGHDVPERGRPSAELMATFRELTSRNGATNEAPGEYDAGVSAADFPPDELPAEVEAERRPRRPVARRGTAGIRQRLTGGGARAGKPKPKAKKAKRPRIPVDRLIERGWDVLARVAAPVSLPLSRTLSIQSPVAGLILEDVIRDTAADRVLQPIAQAEEKAEKVVALVGPPAIVTALQAAQGLPDDQRAIREAILVPMLRESLALLVRVAGDKVEAKVKRDAEMAPVYAKVDEYMAMIFAPVPVPVPEPAEAAAAP